MQINQEKIWVGSYNGITTIENNKFKKYSKSTNNYLNHGISSISQDSKGNIWVAGNNGLTYITSKDTFHINRNNGLHSNIVTCILEDFDGNFLIGTRNQGMVKLFKRKYR